MNREALLTRLEDRINLIGRGLREEYISASGPSPAQNHLLMIIYYQEHMSTKQLATSLGVTSGAITQHVDALEAAGLLSREPNRDNRREVIISLTSQGRAEVAKIRQAKLQILIKLFGDLEDNELEDLVGLIEKASHKYAKGKGVVHGKVQ